MNHKDITVNIKSGDKDLIAAGSFMTYDGDEVNIEILNKETPLLMVFKFVKDETNKEVRKGTENKDNSTLIISFYNYNDIRFTMNPWYIGHINNRKLYIVYRIEPLLNSGSRHITFSLYLGEEVKNG